LFLRMQRLLGLANRYVNFSIHTQILRASTLINDILKLTPYSVFGVESW
jgi:hypothetical protein